MQLGLSTLILLSHIQKLNPITINFRVILLIQKQRRAETKSIKRPSLTKPLLGNSWKYKLI